MSVGEETLTPPSATVMDSVTIEATAFFLRRNWLPVVTSGVLVVAGLLVAQIGPQAALIGYFAAWFGVAAEGCAESELRDALLALSDARDDVSTEAALSSLRR